MLKKIMQKKSNSHKEEAIEENISSKGLILKELPKHLKYASLQPKKGKPVIISARLMSSKNKDCWRFSENIKK